MRSSYTKRLASKLPPGSALPTLSTAAELLLGALAGALAQIFTIPVSVIATRQQVGRPTKLRDNIPLEAVVDNKTDDSFLGVAREIVEEEGVSGLWLGIKPGLVLTVNPAITYGVFERVKNIVLLAQATAKLSPWWSFLIGALSKTLATVVRALFLSISNFPAHAAPQVTYPYIMAKVRIQARSADAEDAVETHHALPKPHTSHHKDGSHHVGALDILSRVWKKEGFTGWYQVCALLRCHDRTSANFHEIGNASADHQGCHLASFAFHIQGTVRTLGSVNHDSPRPFPVQVNHCKVEVLHLHCNIS